MKFNLFFRITQPKVAGSFFRSKFSLLLLFILVGIPSVISASVLENDNLDQGSEGVIYVSGNAVLFGENSISNGKIIEIESTKENVSREPVISTVEKPTAMVPLKKKIATKVLPKPSKPKFVFNSTAPEESFGASTTFNNKNSLIIPTYTAQDVVVCHYTELITPTFLYLLNIYTADFSKTASLSQFLFSRPPPTI